jgi:threonyl-tRNA synthetase
MIHHAIFGSLGRMIAILLEHHGGVRDGAQANVALAEAVLRLQARTRPGALVAMP